MTEIRILRFAPLQLELPAGDTLPAGEVKIILPPVRVMVAKGLGPLLPDGSITSQVDGWGYTMTLPEPLPLGRLVEFVTAVQDTLQALHAELERESMKRPLMGYDQAARSGVLAYALANSLGER